MSLSLTAAVITSLALSAGILIVLRKVLNILLREQFPVHRSGAVLITGASSGIGRHAAEYLAVKGFTVFAGVRKVRDAEAIKNNGNKNMHPLLIDVSNHDSVVKAVSTLTLELKSLQMPLVGLVNNAGVGEAFTAEMHPWENMRGMFDTNFWGAVDLTQEALPLLREGKGRVIMISSVAALVSQPMTSLYCASKKALEGFTDSLRQEVRHFDISVSMVEPAYIKTELLGKIQAMKAETEMSKGEQELMHKQETLYPHLFSKKNRAKKAGTLKGGDTPQVATDAIMDALVSPFPNTRYVVASVNGTPAWVIGWVLWALPDRSKDLILKKMGGNL